MEQHTPEPLTAPSEQEDTAIRTERFRLVLEAANLSLWDYDVATGRVIPSPPGSAPVVENVPESLVASGHIHPDYVDAYLDMYRRVCAGEKYVEGVFLVHTDEHPEYWYEHIRYTNLFDADGKPYLAVGMAEDVSEKRAAQRNYARELQLMQILSAEMYATLLLDVTSWKIMRVQCRDKAFLAQLQRCDATQVFQSAAERVADDPSMRAFIKNLTQAELMRLYEEKTDTLTLEFRRRQSDGTVRWVHEVARLVIEPDTEHLMLFVQMRDIDDDKRRIDELSRAAETDAMTGFLDHSAAMRHMRSYLIGEGRLGSHALFMIDIDNFKSVNDRLGHIKGDEVITRAAESIGSLFRATDILGRVGGDEFLVLMKNAASRSLVVKKAAELVDALQFVCAGETATVSLSASVGVSLYTGEGESLDALYAGADAALYRAKNAGKNCYAIAAGGDADADAPDSAEPSSIVQLRTLLEHMDGGVMLAEIGEHVNVTYVSPSFFKSMHRSPEEAGEHGEKLIGFVFDEDRPALVSALHYTAESGELLDTTFRVRLPGGQLGWRRLRGVQLPGSAADAPSLIGVISDVTEIKRASAQLEAIIENAPCGIGMLEYDGQRLVPLFFNSAVLATVGMDSRECFNRSLGGDAMNGVREEDRPAVHKALVHGMHCEGPFELSYHGVGERDGEPQVIHVRGVRLREYEQNGHPVFLLMYTDVTRQTVMERDLKLAEERYRIAITCADIMLWEVDIPARTMRQSTEVAGRFSHSSPEITDLPDGILEQGNTPPDSIAETRRMFNDMFAGRDGDVYFMRSRIDGESVWLKVRFKVLLNDKDMPYYAVGISEPVPNIDAEMRRFEQEHQLSSLLERSLINVAHVNLSKNRVEYFHAKGGDPSEAAPYSYDELHAYYAQLAADGQGLDEYMAVLSPSFMFNMFRSNQPFLFIGYLRDCGGGPARWTDCAILLMRHPVSGDLFAFIYQRDADARHRWETSVPARVEYEPASKLYTAASMEMLAQHIISDAQHTDEVCAVTVLELVGLDQLRATRSAAVMNELMFTVGRLFRGMIGDHVIAGVLDESRLVLFHARAVSDDVQQGRLRSIREHVGQALRRTHPEEPIELVFGFATALRREADYHSLLKKALIACQSAIRWADSSVAHYIEPARSGEGASAEAPIPETPRPTLLVVDDAPDYRDMMQTLFETDYRVLTAENGAMALETLHAHPETAAVILDLIMPVVNGFQVLEAMRADPLLSTLPVIVVTVDDAPGSEARALDLGASDVIAKPFYGETLIRRTRNIIARSDAAHAREQNRAYELRFQQQANQLSLADYDELTGVYNKRAFCARVRAELRRRSDTRFVIVRWDLDRFKVFNDVFGTQAGDTLLSECGAAMHEYAAGSIYGHLEADHFVLFRPEAEADIDAFTGNIVRFLQEYPVAFNFAPRFGVYTIDEPDIDVGLMCDRALLAVRSIKGSFTNTLAYYDSSLRSQLLDEQSLIDSMQEALEREEFVLYFQPQYNYISGELVGAEALVRWKHPTRGMLLPSEFIPLFEKNGFISLLDRYVWERSCRAMRRWLDEAHRLVPVSIAVNISRLDIYDPQLCTMLKSLVDRYELPPSYLKLEITESAYMENPAQLIEVVKNLQELGFTVEMDDFGSGYSSLNMLKDVPVDVLKLDINFLTHGRDDSRGGNILSSVLRMARWLQLPVIAEGVETREQADYLKSLGCIYMQGYHFSRPLPFDGFERLLVSCRLGAMDMYKNESIEGASAFWDASVQTALVFNNLVGGAAIMEYRGGQLEALRINDSYFRVLGTTREDYTDRQSRILDFLTDETRPLFIDMLERAIATGEEAACETVHKPVPGGKLFWTRTRARLLARSGDSSLFYIAVENITERKELEQRLQLRNYSDMLLSAYDEVLECDYDALTITVHTSRFSSHMHSGLVLTMDKALTSWCRSHVVAADVPLLLDLVSPNSRHTGTIEYRCIRADGERRWVSATMLRIGENLYLLCNQDVTDRREMDLIE